MKLDEAVRAAAAKVKSGKIEGALEVLLAAWPKNPSRELSEAIIALDAKLALPPFEGDTAQWRAAAKKAKPAQWGPLLAALTGKKLSDAVERMSNAASWAADPRTGKAVETIVAATPWSSDTSKDAWRALYSLVEASKNPRFVELAPSLKWNVRPLIKGWLSNGYERAIADLPKEWPVVEASAAKALAALGSGSAPKKTGSKDEAALLADIYARPEDDAPRLVYADLLLEKGDPRGEFIALQISGNDPKREKALLASHGKKWLGALAPALGADFEFRRGFLARANAKFRNQADAEKYAHCPEWATVEDLTWMQPGQIPQGQEPYVRFLAPTMNPTKRVEGAWAPALLAAKRPWQFEEAMRLGLSSPRDFKAILDSPLFPRLKALGVSDSIDSKWFSGITSMKNVKVLQAWLCKDLDKVVPLLSKLGLERFTAWAMTFERGPDGALSKLTFTLDKRSLRTVGGLLHGLPQGLVTSIDFVLERGLVLDPELAQRAKEKIGKAQIPAADEGALPEIDFAREVGFAADGSVIVADERALLVLDASASKLLRQFPIDQIDAARVVAGGKQVVAKGYKRVNLFDLESGEDLAAGKTREGAEEFLVISADGRFVSIGRDGLFDVETKREVKGPRGSGKALVISPDQTWWLVWVATGAPMQLVRADSGVKVPLEGSETAKAFEWSIAGQSLLTRTESHLMKWDTTTGAVTGKLAMKDHGALWLSPNGRYVATQVATEIRVFETATFKPAGTLPVGYAIGLSDDGTRAVVCTDGGARVEKLR